MIKIEMGHKMSCNNCKYCTEFLYCTYWCCAALNFEKEDAEVCKKFIKKDE